MGQGLKGWVLESYDAGGPPSFRAKSALVSGGHTKRLYNAGGVQASIPLGTSCLQPLPFENSSGSATLLFYDNVDASAGRVSLGFRFLLLRLVYNKQLLDKIQKES